MKCVRYSTQVRSIMNLETNKAKRRDICGKLLKDSNYYRVWFILTF